MSGMSYIQRFRPSLSGADSKAAKEVALVIYPGFQVLSLSLSTVFEMANLTAGYEAYHLTLYSVSGGLVRSSLGFSIQTERLPKKMRCVDTIIVAGNTDFRSAEQTLVKFLRVNAPSARRVAGTCTAARFLAEAGLLNGRRATTHWFYAGEFRRLHPEVTIEEDRIFIEDGPFWTSAGMTAGLDLAIALVEKDLGPEIARLVAKKMVVYHRRAGGQSQHSVLLELSPKSDRIQRALTFAKANLQRILSVDQFAQAASLSLRQFNRLFRKETGSSPAQALERLRAEAARLMMESGSHSMDEIAQETGFGQRERMRRAFLRVFGQSPLAMRRITRAQVVSI
jgi:transcriptional regulator GlxA family with amidase domain